MKWWERTGLTEEQANQVLEVVYKLNIAGLGDHVDSLISVITRYAPQPKYIDNLLLIDHERVRDSINRQIRQDWHNRK